MAASWENQIDERVALAKLCFATQTFTPFHVLVAQQFSTFSDDTSNLDPEAKLQIDKINTDVIDSGRDHYKAFSDKVESLKGQQPDQEAWEQTIDDAAAEAKAKSDKIIDDAAATAKGVIQKLPEATRQSAAETFKNGMNKVLVFFETVWNGIKTVVNAVVQFIQNLWGKIRSAWEAVQNAATAAWNWITGGSSYFSGSQAKVAILPVSASVPDVHNQVKPLLEKINSKVNPVTRLSIKKGPDGWIIDHD
ncbi:hypothetical protein BKA67DRAFT_542347 [Truncatella angustata]|uniref:Uncharacterized protein n=1 Tax=Truncatella angustata TaxID=152316 RepID=A0A9P8RIM1_9PEZI|nr:uncharacterized protein BKA67DRAFT_542347 [Truncatella angustata]KAH6643390.1 hypothetical protein BKA67DRAFT_542347 [Truncatella angustata]